VERSAAELARETTSSFEAAWTLLSRNAQLVLRVASAFATPRIPAPLIVSTLQRMGGVKARWKMRSMKRATAGSRPGTQKALTHISSSRDLCAFESLLWNERFDSHCFMG